MKNQNSTVSGLMNLSTSFFILGFVINRIVNKTAGILIYFLFISALISILVGIFKLVKNKEKITYNKILGFINLFAGTLFGLAILINLHTQELQLPIYSIILMALGSLIALFLGIKILTSKK